MYAQMNAMEVNAMYNTGTVEGDAAMRELTVFEIDLVSGGLTNEEAGQIAAILGAGSAIAGAGALGAASLGPLGAPAALAGGAVSAVFGLAAVGFALYAEFA